MKSTRKSLFRSKKKITAAEALADPEVQASMKRIDERTKAKREQLKIKGREAAEKFNRGVFKY